jgi:hypothetical protein
MTMYVRVTAPMALTISSQDEDDDVLLDGSRPYAVLPLWAAQRAEFQDLWADGKVEVATDTGFTNLITEAVTDGGLPGRAMEHRGQWNASTNTPPLTNGVGDLGDVYEVSVAGTHSFGAPLPTGSYVGVYNNGADYYPGQVVQYEGRHYTRVGEPNPGYPPGTGYWGPEMPNVLSLVAGEHVVYNGAAWRRL